MVAVADKKKYASVKFFVAMVALSEKEKQASVKLCRQNLIRKNNLP